MKDQVQPVEENGLASEIQAWAQNAIFHSPLWAMNQLNYSYPSITVVDTVIADQSKESLMMGDDQLTMVTQEYGCYLLETAYRQFGGEFYWSEQYQQPMLVIEQIVGEERARLTLMTWTKVRGRLCGEENDHLIYFMDEFTKAYNGLKAQDNLLFL